MTENKSLKQEVQDEVSRTAEIQVAIETAGGQRILNNLKNGIVSSINEICSSYKKATHPELVASVSKLAERYSIYSMLLGVKKAKKMALKDLEDILKEENL